MKSTRIAAAVILAVAEVSGCTCSNTDPCIGVVCSASDQCHSAGVCNSATGKCSDPAKADGAACSDGNPCTTDDVCKAGVCTAGPALVCPPADQCHTGGTCETVTGSCIYVVKGNGAACNSGNACTTNDTCQNGQCAAGTPVADGTTCDDGNSCTSADHCTGGKCAGSPLEDGSVCDDHNPCTQTDLCQAGVCQGSDPVSCITTQCRVSGTCDPSTGVCTDPTPVTNGTSCSNDDEISNESCTDGTCGCPPGSAVCTNSCADLGSDPHNCGSCGFQCSTATGQSCLNGQCTGGCLPGQIFCGGACVNPNSDPNHCGTCENACTPPQVCSTGSCQDACGAGLTFCDPLCVDTSTDANDCGKCGNACGASQVCADGKCQSRALASSCLPASSLAVDIGSGRVTAYVPNGAWGKSIKGVQVVPVEGPGARASIATADVVNSCGSNSSTHQTVCVANGTDVYVIQGSKITTTMTSAGKGTLGFTGGDCTTCGVAVDGLNNIAWVTISNNTTPAPDSRVGAEGDGVGIGGFQAINLAGGSLFGGPKIIAGGDVTSEDIAVDPLRHLILSPNENANYQLVDTRTNTVYDNPLNLPADDGPDLDSAAEYCTTGIAL
ncbi:MAG TPA: hypothetical protein VLW85_20580, partial [Myxococcales bacterium]|nr:hypothetical protein [Myxococcales bacterium]